MMMMMEGICCDKRCTQSKAGQDPTCANLYNSPDLPTMLYTNKTKTDYGTKDYLVWFYGISIIIGYLMPDLVYKSYISNIYE